MGFVHRQMITDIFIHKNTFFSVILLYGLFYFKFYIPARSYVRAASIAFNAMQSSAMLPFMDLVMVLKCELKRCKVRSAIYFLEPRQTANETRVNRGVTAFGLNVG
jgi:hypothetical protein